MGSSDRGKVGQPFDYMGIINRGLNKINPLKGGSGAFGEGISAIGPQFIGYAKDYLVKIAEQFFSKIAQAAGGVFPGGSAGEAEAEEWIRAGYKAAKALPLTESNVAKTKNLAWEESGWDPKAQNPTSVGGENASGFLQMLPSTFQAYMVSGMSDIWNAVHNAASSLRYQDARYGYAVEHAPYSEGGIVMSDQLVRLGEQGMREAVIPLDNPRAQANSRAALGFDVMEAKMDALIDALTRQGITIAYMGDQPAVVMGEAARNGAKGYISTPDGQQAVRGVGQLDSKRSRLAGG
jgi:hypothetical protein